MAADPGLAQAALVLERLEWLRLEQPGDGDTDAVRQQRLQADADGWLDAETVLE